MILSLVLKGYLKQQFHQSKSTIEKVSVISPNFLPRKAAYSTLAYLALTPSAVRFTRFSTLTEYQKSGSPVKMYINVQVAEPKSTLKRKPSTLVKPKAAKKRQVAKPIELIVLDDDEDEEEEFEHYEIESDGSHSDERALLDEGHDMDEWGFPLEVWGES